MQHAGTLPQDMLRSRAGFTVQIAIRAEQQESHQFGSVAILHFEGFSKAIQYSRCEKAFI